MQQNKLSISNILILLSIFFTLLTFVIEDIYMFGMHRWFFDAGVYHVWLAQMFSSQFLHGSILHLLFNSIFIYYFWNILDNIIGYKKMLIFFISNALFVWVILTFFAGHTTTVGISSFALALLTYYTLLLKQRNNPEYTGGITAIVINIAIWLSPGISFLWHFGWMLFWAIFFFTQKKK